MAREPRHLYRLLPLLDPLLRRAPLVVEPHHCPTRCLQVSHDEPHSREQLPGMELNLRPYSSCGLPTGGLIEKALVPHDGLVTGPSHRARQQFLDVSLQTSVGRKPDRILYPSLFQFLVDLRLGEAASARNTTSVPSSCWRSISGRSISSQSSPLCTLPGRSFAPRQSPSPL